MSGTTASIGVGIAVQPVGRAPVWLPQTPEEYLALPEHETATCPRCESSGVAFHNDVGQCRCGYRWRWPSGMGLD